MSRMIAGAGGGGGKGGGGGASRAPVEAKDSLRSKAFARVIDVVGEGEIEGLVDGLKSVYLDGTPIQNDDFSMNFTGVEMLTRNGTQAQSYMPGFPQVESTQAVAVEVTNAVPMTRQITNEAINAVRVTIAVPQLTEQNTTTGDLNGSQVVYAIDLQSNGGGFVEVLRDTVSGKTTSRYQRSHRIELTGPAPWDVRVRRITADSATTSLVNKTWWDSYTEIIDAKMRYPNSALVGLKIDSSQFQNIPTRGYDVKLLRVKVPSNYNPTWRSYSGSWDGTFVVAWTDNPAWCFYDLVTNDRYGLGAIVDDALVDKWALYAIGKYCDELVPDGFGDYEPRFTCNLYLQTRQEAFKVLRDFASIFRGMVYWGSGAITATQDAPADPVALLVNGNVIGGRFTYSGSSLKTRHTVALVTWNDPDDMYRQKVEYVEDTDGITRYGVQQTEVVAMGCTSRGQANRVGRWLLYSERMETETVQFSMGLDGAMVRPGNIIKVADSARASARLGGRVNNASNSTVVVDKAPTISIAGFTLYCTLADGTVQARTVSTLVGSAITVSEPFTSPPVPQGIWVLSGVTVEAQTFRVITVAEDADSGQFTVSALSHNPAKFAAIESGIALQPRQISVLRAAPAAPTGGALSEYLYSKLTDVKVGVDISWEAVDGAAGYAVSYRVRSGNWVNVNCATNLLQLSDAQDGDYTIKVYSVSPLGVKSAEYQFVATVFGKTAKPADVVGLLATVQGDTGLLQWDLHADLDVRIGGQIVARYSEETVGASWNTALQVGEFPGGATSGAVAMRSGSYLLKARDSLGNYSQNPAIIVTDAPNIMQFNAVASSTQEPLFAGTKTGLAVVNDRLVLDNATYVDSIADFDLYAATMDEGLVASGQYEFDSYIDTGAVYTSRIAVSFGVVTYSTNNIVDAWPFIDSIGPVDEGVLFYLPVDDYADWDAVVVFDAAADLGSASINVYVATTNGNPVDVPLWSDWRTFVLGDYTARAFKFKVEVNRGADANNQVALNRLGVTVDVPDRVESANNIALPADGAAVLFQNAFFATPAIAVTAENLATGDYAVITAKSATGFTIQFKNSAGAGVARTFDWIAKGYGYQN